MTSFIGVRLLPRMDTVDERDWLPAARRGEPWALEQFYQGYQPQVYALCHRMLGREEDAQDAMQAAFVQAFRALPGFRGDSAVRTWLYRIALNEALTLLRRRKRAPEPLHETTSVPDGAKGIQRKLAVQTALAHVHPDQKALLVLRYWEGLGYEDIAAVLNITVSAVKMRLNRAREEFRKMYGEEP